MNRILFALSLSAFALGASAQTYDKLWKKAQDDVQKDLPQQALKSVMEIHAKALSEHNDAQLLRAELMQLVLKGEVSNDSIDVLIARMERALSQEQRPVMQALWHSALAQVYANRNAGVWNNDTLSASQARCHATAALSRPDLLAETKATDYMPLFVAGKQSQVFGDDLLHILLQAHQDGTSQPKSEVLQRAIDVYRKLGRKDAVLLLTLEQLRTDRQQTPIEGRVDNDPRYQELKDLAAEHASSTWNALTYTEITHLNTLYDEDSHFKSYNDSLLIADARQAISLYGKKGLGAELCNFVAEMESPSAEMKSLPQSGRPSEAFDVQFKVRNLQKVEVNFVPIAESSQQLDASNLSPEDLRKKVKDGIITTGFTFPAHPAHEWSTQSGQLTLPNKPGVYLAEMRADGKPLDCTVVHVTALSAISFAYPDGKNRVTVVDSHTGHPVKGARIVQVAYDSRSHSNRQTKAYETDNEGTVIISDTKRRCRFYVSTPNDKASLPFTLNEVRYNTSFTENARTSIDLFTDRAIYRPGQTLQVSGVAYTKQDDQISVVQAYEGKLLLRNANRKVVDSLAVKCDDFGSFSASFKLPEETLTGYFSLEMGNGSSVGYASFQVEEYKRPTFTAETLPVTSAYALGDSINVEGKAMTYTGIPVCNARVQYNIQRSYHGWRTSGAAWKEQQGEVQTDAEGHFFIPVQLSATEEEQTEAKATRYFYTVSYTVTADNGETAQGSTTLHTANRKAWLEHNVPSSICKIEDKTIPYFTVRQVNAAGQNTDVMGQYLLRSAQGQEVERGSFRTSVPFLPQSINHLSDGQYELVIHTEEGIETDTARFDFFTDKVSRPVDHTQTLFAHNITSASADSVHVMLGSPNKDVLVFCDVLSGGKLLESRRFMLSDSVVHEHYAYKPEWGDGADIYYAFMQDGKLYTHHAEVRKPLPEKKLNLVWKTFRSRLIPGQQERWTLQVTHPDGTPAESQVMACLYDGSLDALARHAWVFSNVGFYRRSTYASWESNNNLYEHTLYGTKGYERMETSTAYRLQHDFTRWNPELFPQQAILYEAAVSPTNIRLQGRGRVKEARMMKAEALVALDTSENAADKQFAVGGTNSGNFADAIPTDVTPRTNFAETAFFRPMLRTDAKGEVNIDFTLPESTTQWNFRALAHSHYMDYGSTDTTVVARKEFMVQPALPRFIRKGDETQIPIQVSNLMGKTVKATLRLQLVDALTEKTVFSEKSIITLQGNETKVFPFTYKATTDAPMLICRATAEGQGYADGEEHYLPVMSNEVEVTRTLPFSLTEKGFTTLRIDTLFASPQATHRSLTVELTSNPTWTAVSSLPAMVSSTGEMSATEWATQLYALILGQHISEGNPVIRQWANAHSEEADALSRLKLDGMTDLTPWLRQAQQEAQRGQALRLLFDPEVFAARKHTALDKLASLQGTDGGWSWYPGMPASPYVTTDVATVLARIERLTENKDVHPALERALTFLQAQTALEVKEMKKAERESKQQQMPSELQLRYLYIRTMMGLKCNDADSRYLLDRAKQLSKQLSMYGKSLMAVVLAANGEEKEAQLTLQSLMEHTVSTPVMGRYFDSYRAESSPSSYRIPTQCAAIEALLHFGKTQEAEEMRMWLMQSKRTQMWETSRASADAVFALLYSSDGQSEDKRVMSLSATQPIYFTLLNGKKIVGINSRKQTSTPSSAGYFRETYNETPATEATTLQVRKDTDGLAWGAVYASATLPSAEVKDEGKELHLDRKVQVMKNSTWFNVDTGTKLSKGDRLRQVFTLQADRDFDFVQLSASRPACTEPSEALSGYRWTDGISAYRAVHDASTDYFIEHVSKGKHTFTEELLVDRSGHYASGICTLKCVYAPEFSATSAEMMLDCQ